MSKCGRIGPTRPDGVGENRKPSIRRSVRKPNVSAPARRSRNEDYASRPIICPRRQSHQLPAEAANRISGPRSSQPRPVTGTWSGLDGGAMSEFARDCTPDADRRLDGSNVGGGAGSAAGGSSVPRARNRAGSCRRSGAPGHPTIDSCSGLDVFSSEASCATLGCADPPIKNRERARCQKRGTDRNMAWRARPLEMR